MAEEDAKNRLKAKQRFYAGLDSLDQSDDELDPGLEASKQVLLAAVARKAKLVSSNSSARLPRSVSDSNVGARAPSSKSASDATTISGPSLSTTHPATLRKGATFSGRPGTAMPPVASTPPVATMPPVNLPAAASNKTLGKRKRDTALKLVPEPQRIFRDLHFYFFPNDDRNPARRMRITKALEFGAVWEKTWSEEVTHVIVDKAPSLDFALLLKYLKQHDKIEAIPPKVAIVSENYPSECISYRVILDPTRKQFQVKGYVPVPAPVEAEVPVSSGTSDTSLKLKPAGKDVRTREPETPQEEHSATAAPTKPTADAASGKLLAGKPPSVQSTTAVQSTTEFDAVIQQARDLRDVALDSDEETSDVRTSSAGHGSDDEPESSRPVDNRNTKSQQRQEQFTCMQKHTGENRDTPNAATTHVLQQMATYYDQIGDQWRTRAYRQAISSLRKHPVKIWTKEEALALPKVGERLATKIEEIATTNRLRRLDHAHADSNDRILRTFMGVYGAGFTQANQWIAQGYRTLDELLEKASLTDNQRIGIQHYEDFNSRIPRAEVEQHGAVVRQALQRIDASIQVIVGGSYRRGAQSSGDVDCIITGDTATASSLRTTIFERLIPTLTAAGFLVASLAVSSRDDGSKWHGASCLPGSTVWRRIDFLLVPADEIGAALIYFTGNDIFNRSLRLLASTKGMRLNQRGLYKDVIRGKGRVKLTEGTLVEGRSERRIFEALGVPWRPPEHRIC